MDTKVIVTNRLSQSAYSALEKQTLGLLPIVPASDGAAYVQAGIELVLRMLRRGYVIESGE